MTNILTTHEVQSLIAIGAQIVDVRSSAEFSQGAIKGAINLPVDKLHLKTVAGLDSGKPVVVYCRTGGRSARAQEWLLKQGFRAVHNAGSLCNLT